MPADHPGALSWRDVYKAVNDSEVRIISAVRESVGSLRTASDDHELRLRHLEKDGCPAGQEAKTVSKALGMKLDALTTLVNANTDARRGMFSTLGYGQKVLLFTAAMVGMSAVLLDILSKYL
jgi:hypothetical protein